MTNTLPTETKPKRLRSTPDMYSKGHTVFIEGTPIGDFEKPWEVIIAIERGITKWLKGGN